MALKTWAQSQRPASDSAIPIQYRIGQRPSKHHALTLWRSGLQRQRVQFPAHFALERLVDELVLLHPRFALERARDDGRRIMIAIARKVADRHLRIRNPGADQPLYFASVHCHGARPSSRPPPCSRAASLRAARAKRLAELGA